MHYSCVWLILSRTTLINFNNLCFARYSIWNLPNYCYIIFKTYSPSEHAKLIILNCHSTTAKCNQLKNKYIKKFEGYFVFLTLRQRDVIISLCSQWISTSIKSKYQTSSNKIYMEICLRVLTYRNFTLLNAAQHHFNSSFSTTV